MYLLLNNNSLQARDVWWKIEVYSCTSHTQEALKLWKNKKHVRGKCATLSTFSHKQHMEQKGWVFI